MSRDTKPHTIRFPVELYEDIKAQAEADRRTFNAEVCWLLEQGMLNQVSLGQLQMTLQERKESVNK